MSTHSWQCPIEKYRCVRQWETPWFQDDQGQKWIVIVHDRHDVCNVVAYNQQNDYDCRHKISVQLSEPDGRRSSIVQLEASNEFRGTTKWSSSSSSSTVVVVVRLDVKF